MAWMSEEVAATVLGVSFKTIRRRVGNGSIRAMRQGRQIFVDIEIARVAGPSRPTTSTRSNAAAANTGATGVTAISGAATLDAPATEPVGFLRPTRAPSIAPMPAKPLAATTLSIASSPSRMSANAIQTSSRELHPERWAWLATWLLLTLLLTASTVAAWVHQRGQSRLQETESQYQRMLLDAQQTQDKQSKLITGANERERKLIAELSAANTKYEETDLTLAMQRNAVAKLKASLDKTTADLAKTNAERKAIADKLISTQMMAQVWRSKAVLVDAVQQLANRISQPQQPSRTTADRLRNTADRTRAIPQQPVDINDHDWTRTTPANAQAAAENATNESDENTVYHRPLPHQPPTLDQEDARAALRAIVKSVQDNADDATADQAGIAPAPN